MTLLAFGCSVAHGTEIVAPGNSKLNIPYSYPALVAKHLGVDCVNHAFCGNSNENIFHEALDTIPQHETVTAVVIGWKYGIATNDYGNLYHPGVQPRPQHGNLMLISLQDLALCHKHVLTKKNTCQC